MIRHSHSKAHLAGKQSQSLLLLCGWLSLPIGLGALSLHQQAQAIDIESPALTEPSPVTAAAPPVDTFIDPPEPAWDPAPAPAIPTAPEPVALPQAAPAAPIATPQPAPAVSPKLMPQVAGRSAPSQPTENTYIDPQPYSLGETAQTPAAEKTVLAGSVSGCRASLNVDPVVAATLCGPPVVQTAKRSIPRAPAPQYTPVAASTSNSGASASKSYSYSSYQQPAPRQWTAYAPSPAPTAWSTKASSSLSPLAKASPVLKSLPSSPNPLKWLVPNRQRMIFPLPMPVSVTSAFGWRSHPITGETRFHSGTDLAAPTGTPVLAAFPGQVETSGFMGGYGLAVLLQHQEGQLATRYAHLSKIYVQPGQWVSQGTIIGLVGSTGNSTGPHLHFETLKKKDNSLVAFDAGVQLKVSLADLIKAMQTAKVPPQPQG
ncbi:M23 family metallopeptidase [Acaryochloris sp. IP29b_bin.148]|uniref:M23 family metallopeptidase n=1 Tax=Acaryochloris sp. IP29b_bin.148 TaxID=2969218 RepID=UPI00262BB83C|nr:M23 family metallopeptidase [Acaryochloris sp. IP29b_bin.148]